MAGRGACILAMLVALCGCRSAKSTGTNAARLAATSTVDASAAPVASAPPALVDAAAGSDAPPAPHVATEGELAYVRKLRALAHRCTGTHNEIACTEGRLRAMDVSGLHCGHDAVAQDLRFAWAASRQLDDATQMSFDGEPYWVETKSALSLDDIDRIDQEPMFLDRNKGYDVADEYDGNNVVGGAYHIRFRRPWLVGTELARVRALSKAGAGKGGINLAIVRGKTIIAMAVGNPEAPASKQIVVTSSPSGLCTRTEDWQLPEDLESAFDPAPP